MSKKYDFKGVAAPLLEDHADAIFNQASQETVNDTRDRLLAAAEVKPKTARQVIEHCRGLSVVDRQSRLIMAEISKALDAEEAARTEANERAAKDAEFRRRVLEHARRCDQSGGFDVSVSNLFRFEGETK